MPRAVRDEEDEGSCAINRWWFAYWFLPVALLLHACSPAGADPVVTPNPTPLAGADPTERIEPTAAPALDQEPPRGAEGEFRTDFSIASVDFREILSGGPPKDGIPAVDDPRFISAAEADGWLKPNEPVIHIQVGDQARAYPIQILVWHEIVNDTVAGVPVLVTFCPLCNTAIAFERTVEGRVLDFGTTGRLRFSNLIMYDRQTESWWQQATGEAIVGEFTGTQLTFVPAPIVAWEDFYSAYPASQVLSTETGHLRPYGQNPYVGYDAVGNSPFLYRGPPTPAEMRPMTRVLAIDLNEDVVAFPYPTLEEQRVVSDTIGGQEVVVFWEPGTASALDRSDIPLGRDVGSANAFLRDLNGRQLSFEFDGSYFVDTETGSRWNILGTAVQGELAGSHLPPVVAVNHFWFSWVAFQPETRVFQP